MLFRNVVMLLGSLFLGACVGSVGNSEGDRQSSHQKVAVEGATDVSPRPYKTCSSVAPKDTSSDAVVGADLEVGRLREAGVIDPEGKAYEARKRLKNDLLDFAGSIYDVKSQTPSDLDGINGFWDGIHIDIPVYWHVITYQEQNIIADKEQAHYYPPAGYKDRDRNKADPGTVMTGGYGPDVYTVGDISDASIQATMDLINNAYNFYTGRIHFELMKTERVSCEACFWPDPVACEDETQPSWTCPGTAEWLMKSNYGSRTGWETPWTALHIYTANTLDRAAGATSTLGWNSAWPSELSKVRRSSMIYMDGIIVDFRTTANGQWSYYDENHQLQTVNFQGDTLVHEVGHWVGLYHPWNFDCDENDPQIHHSDMVWDTPMQSFEYFVDPCPASPSVQCYHTPIPETNPPLVTNFMQYTDDSCRTVPLTYGQSIRLLAQIQAFRKVYYSYLPIVRKDPVCSDYNNNPGDCYGYPEFCTYYFACNKCVPKDVTENEACCIRQCGGKECGPDNCGGSCGTCVGSYEQCNTGNGQCECSAGHAPCFNPTNYTSVCCETNQTCGATGCTTATCSCAGRSCGPNSCGQGSCGTCGANQQCNASGQCECQYTLCNGTCCASGQQCINGSYCGTPSCSCPAYLHQECNGAGQCVCMSDYISCTDTSSLYCCDDHTTCANGGCYTPVCSGCASDPGQGCWRGTCTYCGWFTEAGSGHCSDLSGGHCGWYSGSTGSICLKAGRANVGTCLNRTPPDCGTGCSNYTCVDKCLPTGTPVMEVCGY